MFRKLIKYCFTWLKFFKIFFYKNNDAKRKFLYRLAGYNFLSKRMDTIDDFITTFKGSSNIERTTVRIGKGIWQTYIADTPKNNRQLIVVTRMYHNETYATSVDCDRLKAKETLNKWMTMIEKYC